MLDGPYNMGSDCADATIDSELVSSLGDKPNRRYDVQVITEHKAHHT